MMKAKIPIEGGIYLDAKMKSKASFNRQAATYDISNYSKDAQECYPYVMQTLKGLQFKSIMDLGCGTGAVLERIHQQNGEAQLFGLDLSENMLERAKQRLGLKATLTVGDAENLPYDDNSFDLVYCVESFHHYPNPLKALSEIKRVLKKGGEFLLCDFWISSPARQLMNLFIRFGDDGDVHIYSKQEITKLLHKIGFIDIKWKRITNHAYICTGDIGN